MSPVVDSTGFAALAASAQLLTALSAGLLTSLTPCVYPLIPITLAIFGATSERSRLRAFVLSFAYVLGIAVTYTALGVVSVLTGSVFGALLGNPFVVALLVIFLVALAFFTLDLLPLAFIAKTQTAAGRIGGRGIGGAFLMGAVSGVVAGPCVGPILVLVLGVAAVSGSVTWGATLLFTYAFGLGFPFLLLGTFSGLVRSLPRAGSWLNAVKFITAVALLAAAQFLAWPILRRAYDPSLEVDPLVLVIFGGIAFFAAWIAYRREIKLLKLVAALALVLTISPAIILQGDIPELDWQPSLEQAMTSAASNEGGRLVMLDLYADWCQACRELDQITFADKQVAKKLSAFSLARVDFTAPSEATDQITRRYAVKGLPCLLFLDSLGNELADSRVEGFLDPQQFAAHITAVLQRYQAR